MTARAEFAQLQPGRVILLILSRSIRPLLACAAGEMNDYSVFTFFSHIIL